MHRYFDREAEIFHVQKLMQQLGEKCLRELSQSIIFFADSLNDQLQCALRKVFVLLCFVQPGQLVLKRGSGLYDPIPGRAHQE